MTPVATHFFKETFNSHRFTPSIHAFALFAFNVQTERHVNRLKFFQVNFLLQNRNVPG
jgi:hypothetical protein